MTAHGRKETGGSRYWLVRGGAWFLAGVLSGFGVGKLAEYTVQQQRAEYVAPFRHWMRHAEDPTVVLAASDGDIAWHVVRHGMERARGRDASLEYLRRYAEWAEGAGYVVLSANVNMDVQLSIDALEAAVAAFKGVGLRQLRVNGVFDVQILDVP